MDYPSDDMERILLQEWSKFSFHMSTMFMPWETTRAFPVTDQLRRQIMSV